MRWGSIGELDRKGALAEGIRDAIAEDFKAFIGGAT